MGGCEFTHPVTNLSYVYLSGRGWSKNRVVILARRYPGALDISRYLQLPPFESLVTTTTIVLRTPGDRIKVRFNVHFIGLMANPFRSLKIYQNNGNRPGAASKPFNGRFSRSEHRTEHAYCLISVLR